jgi:hypothetical protein
MSEYFLADVKAEERARQRELARNDRPAAVSKQEMKASLLGDFLSPGHEPQGFDPYNNVEGRPARDVWHNRRNPR